MLTNAYVIDRFVRVRGTVEAIHPIRTSKAENEPQHMRNIPVYRTAVIREATTIQIPPILTVNGHTISGLLCPDLPAQKELAREEINPKM